MKNRCVIIGGANIENYEPIRSILQDDDFLFIENADVKENYKRKLRYYLEKHSEKITMETIGKSIKIGTHGFRKLRGQHLLNDGVGIEKLQKLYQHEDVNTTMIYLEVEETQINMVLMDDVNRPLMKLQ